MDAPRARYFARLKLDGCRRWLSKQPLCLDGFCGVTTCRECFERHARSASTLRAVAIKRMRNRCLKSENCASRNVDRYIPMLLPPHLRNPRTHRVWDGDAVAEVPRQMLRRYRAVLPDLNAIISLERGDHGSIGAIVRHQRAIRMANHHGLPIGAGRILIVDGFLVFSLDDFVDLWTVLQKRGAAGSVSAQQLQPSAYTSCGWRK